MRRAPLRVSLQQALGPEWIRPEAVKVTLRCARRTLGRLTERLEARRPGRAGLVEALAEGAGEGRRGVRPGRAAGAEELGDLADPLRLDEPVDEGAGHGVRRVRVHRVGPRPQRAHLRTPRRLAG